MMLFIAFSLGVVTLIIMTALSVRMSDVQVPFRYSGYGFTNLYRDRWYALLSFVLFGFIAFGANLYLAIRLHEQRRGLALGLLAISVLFIALTIVIANAIFQLAAFSL